MSEKAGEGWKGQKVFAFVCCFCMDAMLITDLLLYDRMCEEREERAERYVTVSVGFSMDAHVVLLGACVYPG